MFINQNRINYNQHILPMRNKLLRDLMNSWKTFSASCWLWKPSPCKKLSRCLKKWRLVRGQVNMVNEAKLHSPICSIFWSVACATVGRCCGEALSPFCWGCWLQMLEFFVHHVDMLSILLRYNGLTWIQKAVVGQTGSRPPVSMTFFWCEFGSGKCFGASPSSHWAGHRQLYKIHLLLFIPIWSRNGSLLHSMRENNTSDQWYFWFLVRSRGFHSSSFFTFPICFKCRTTTEWSPLSSLEDRLEWLLSVGHCQLLTSHSDPHLQGFCLLCKIFWTTLHCMFVGSSWAKCIVDGSCLHCFMTHFELE